MIYLNCDYNEGAHERVMENLLKTNMEQTIGYGCDEHCDNARKLISKLIKNDKADIHFLVGGTQTNETVIAAALRPFQGVLAAETGHINVHETGAIESCGHKVLALPSADGKITAKQVEDYYFAHINDDSAEHMVQPKMVYISQPTELGTTYSKAELQEIYSVCKSNELFLFIDGARLGYAMAARSNDISFEDLANNSDVFYIGGTKQGLLFGEAVVITNDALKKDFRYMIKQKGGMLAKGRLLGVQFETVFEDGLYLEMAKNAIVLADQIRATLDECGIKYLVENDTNQIFAIFKDSDLDILNKKFVLSYQERIDSETSAVRICTSWATNKLAADEFCHAVRTLQNKSN